MSGSSLQERRVVLSETCILPLASPVGMWDGPRSGRARCNDALYKIAEYLTLAGASFPIGRGGLYVHMLRDARGVQEAMFWSEEVP